MGNAPSCNCIDTKTGTNNEITINNSDSNSHLPTVKFSKSGVVNDFTRANSNTPPFAFNLQCPGVEITEHEGILQRENKAIKETETRIGEYVLPQLENPNLKKMSILYPDNSIYVGTFNSEWIKEGNGTLFLPDGSKYRGEFVDDAFNGSGRLIYPQGDYYEGTFAGNLPSGTGMYDNNEGTIYNGQWEDEYKTGRGVEIYPDGSRYTGDFVKDNKQGVGRFEWEDGKAYEGDIYDNNFEGFGKMTKPDGKIYIGTWRRNKIEGQGIFLWPDEKRYVGNYQNNKKNGFGILLFGRNTIYKGFWLNGKQHGLGWISINNEPELCEWRFGKKIKKVSSDDSTYPISTESLTCEEKVLNEFLVSFDLLNYNEGNLKQKINNMQLC